MQWVALHLRLSDNHNVVTAEDSVGLGSWQSICNWWRGLNLFSGDG